MISLNSSVIAAVDYDAAAGSLIVRFHCGSTYTHPGVPLSVYLELVNATSPGRFYNTDIRGRYR